MGYTIDMIKQLLDDERDWADKVLAKIDDSLLDWDIILFKPIINSFISYNNKYQGKPSLSDDSSFQLLERSEHWRREINDAVDSGKTVIVYLSDFKEVYIDTGTGDDVINFIKKYQCQIINLTPDPETIHVIPEFYPE